LAIPGKLVAFSNEALGVPLSAFQLSPTI